MQKKTLIASALLGATAFSLAVALPANADTHSSTVTVAVVGDVLSSTVQPTTAMTEATPGGISTGTTAITVSDRRGLGENWSTSVIASDFASATVTTTPIPAANLTFAQPDAVLVGTASLVNTAATGDNVTAGALVTATEVTGINSATWTQGLSLAVPAATLVAPDYTATVSYSTL
jgi:hypothetical protein